MTKPVHRLCHTWVGNTCKYCGIKYECTSCETQPVATLHDDGYWTWKKGTTPPHESNYAGWRMDVYAAPTPERADAEKDVTLTNEDLEKLFFWVLNRSSDASLLKFKEFARAILAANKEK